MSVIELGLLVTIAGLLLATIGLSGALERMRQDRNYWRESARTWRDLTSFREECRQIRASVERIRKMAGEP